MSAITRSNLDEIFRYLNTRLGYSWMEQGPLEFVVCGAAALLVSEPTFRGTDDIDILTFIHESKPSDTIAGLGGVEYVAAEVGRELGLRDDWLNFAAKPLLNVVGLVPGLLERKIRIPYGGFLTIHFIHRRDSIAYKMFAAINPKQFEKHIEDLMNLKCTAEEIIHAASWLLARETSPGFRGCLQHVIDALGFAGIAQSVTLGASSGSREFERFDQ